MSLNFKSIKQNSLSKFYSNFFTDATAEKKTEGVSGSEPVTAGNTNNNAKANPDKTESTTSTKPENPAAPEKLNNNQATKHDSGLNPIKSDSTTKDSNAKESSKEDSAKEKPSKEDSAKERLSKEDSAKDRPSKKSSSHLRSTKLPSCSLPVNMQPTFYVGGGNGVSL